MPLFLIKRSASDMDQDDIDAAIIRAMACASSVGVRWVTSYWDQKAGFTYCVYEANSEADIREHSRRGSLACDEVWEVASIDPSMYGATKQAAVADHH